MSHPLREKSLTPSKQSPYTSSAAIFSNPFASQAQPSHTSNSPQSIFNQKIIPRDYLRSKSFTIASPPAIDTPRTVESPTKRLRREHSEPDFDSSRDGLRSQHTPPPGRSGKATPDSDVFGDEDITLAKTRSPTSAEPHLPSSESNPISKRETPAVVSAGAPARFNMPRTSSIDSAISTVSNTSLQRATGNIRNPSPSDIRDLIATAGGAENLIVHLLKDKNNVASQNTQLWKLVEKQRALLLGLNKDLERITRERDRYKKKVKDVQVHVSGIARKATESPDDETSQLTSGAQKKDEITPTEMEGGYNVSSPGTSQSGKGSSPIDLAMMPQPLSARQGDKESPVTNDSANTKTSNAIVESQTSVSTSVPALEVDTDKVQPIKPQTLDTDVIHDDSPPFAVTITTPASEKSGKAFPSSRKAPPKPLNLGHSKEGSITSIEMSAKSELTSGGETPDRGRRRTRAEDDRERELSAMQSDEARSRSSKKNKPAKLAPITAEHKAPLPDAPTGLPLSPRPQHAHHLLSPLPQQLTNNATLGERMLVGSLKSPGLPLSPRPMHNPVAGISLPMSPRANGQSFPLSPRAPKQPLPIPTNPAAPVDAAVLQSTQHKMPEVGHHDETTHQTDRLHIYEPPASSPPSVYNGLAVPAYPNLLLPPNALPSIQVKVASSRSRPSRHSMLGLTAQEDLTVFSLAVISRSSNSELWHVEKVPSSLPQLEQHLKQHCSHLPKMPDRKMFNGQSPVLSDTRKKAIDEYFEELLDTHIDEQAAVTICKYLSTDVLDPDLIKETPPATNTNNHDVHHQNGNRIFKTGYLTKKGKNFGGWKSRYFVLDSSELRYYESSGGTHLGTIRLQNSQIGKQKQGDSPIDEQDGQYRHAFLIQEPKRKDSSMYMRHVLCAESDDSRDEWVRLLLHYTDGAALADSHTGTAERGQSSRKASLNEKTVTITKDGQLVKDTHSNTPTPTSVSSTQDSPSNDYTQRETRPHAAAISGPVNGGVISDPSTWGNRMVPHMAKETKDKSYKMSNIFNFKRNEHATHAANEQRNKPRILRHNGYVRPVFGMPLAEAVEFCAPFNVEVELPAVVYRSIEYLRFRNAANDEGLFRLSGSNTTVRMLKERFNSEGDVDLLGEDEYHDVHAVASLFKTYLRELPSTLLTRELHIEFVKVLELDQSSEKISAFNVLVHRLPRVNFMLLKALSQYLVEVTQMSDKNKMSVRNMGIVFSPTLNIPTPVFTLFLTEYDAIFEMHADDLPNPRTIEVKSPQSLSPSDIRSPRHQTFSDVSTPAYHQTTFPGLPANPHDKAPGTANPGDFGMIPVQSSYESGNYVSVPEAHPHPVQPMTQMTEGGFNSLNGLLAPDNALSIKAKRRESAMIFGSK